MVKVLKYRIVVSEFELQSRYNVHFGLIPLQKSWIILSLQPVISLIVPQLAFYKGRFGIR